MAAKCYNSLDTNFRLACLVLHGQKGPAYLLPVIKHEKTRKMLLYA